ncbi:MAG: cytochrome c biogenesis protein [Archaeoglobaceae archaeon]|nr:cytochrome c biogenesis protein [Archaeoglobaceae archaeon]MCX8151608.1 cytochrome c biogenesis protein [Archaeoglobaceae archaeon]MDW8013114.1 cytochrome c biogenesis protein [Archaeoglobaceae archaeon]
MKLILFVLGFVILAYGTVNVYALPPLNAPTIAENYRIIFFHVPAAISSFLAFSVTFASSLAYLRKNKKNFDILAESSARFGFVMITAAILSGSIWAKVAWGTYWHWDPRQTFTLVLWFAFAAYIALRASIDDEVQKMKYSSVYSIFAFFSVPMTYFSSIIFPSLHPTTSELSFDFIRALFLIIMLLAFVLIFLSYLLLDYSIRKREVMLRTTTQL